MASESKPMDIEEEVEDIEMGDEDMDMEMGAEDIEGGEDIEVEDEEELAVESLRNRVGNILESYVEKKTIKANPTQYINSRVKKIQEKQNIKKHYNSVEQELSVEKFLKENKTFNFKTVTKKGNIILNSKDNKVIVSKDGSVR